MDKDYNMVCGIDKLAELLIERGIEFCVNDEVSLAFKDDVGNLHECWMAGADENRVNALIVVTPEQLLSVPDLNGIIAENAKLLELCTDLVRLPAVSGFDCYGCKYDEWTDCRMDCKLIERAIELGIEVK